MNLTFKTVVISLIQSPQVELVFTDFHIENSNDLVLIKNKNTCLTLHKLNEAQKLYLIKFRSLTRIRLAELLLDSNWFLNMFHLLMNYSFIHFESGENKIDSSILFRVNDSGYNDLYYEVEYEKPSIQNFENQLVPLKSFEFLCKRRSIRSSKKTLKKEVLEECITYLKYKKDGKFLYPIPGGFDCICYKYIDMRSGQDNFGEVYDCKHHFLEKIKQEKILQYLTQLEISSEVIPSWLIIIGFNPKDICKKYGEKSHSLLSISAGSIITAMQIIGDDLSMGICPLGIGSFSELESEDFIPLIEVAAC